MNQIFILFLFTELRGEVNLRLLTMFYREAFNMKPMDCYVKLDVLTDEQIAELCRPKRDVVEIVDAPEPVAFVELENAEGIIVKT